MTQTTLPTDFSLEKLQHLRQLKANIQQRHRSLNKFIKPNGRSADFCLSIAHGCLLGCSYCYVQRNNINGNPLTIYSNDNELLKAVINWHSSLPSAKPQNYKPCSSPYPSGESDFNNYTYDIGESVDLLLGELSNKTNWWLEKLVAIPSLKPTFATKISTPVAVSRLIDCPSARKARIRASVAPQHIIDQTEVLTAKVSDRIAGLNLAYQKGYECHLNFSPIVITPTWVEDYTNLMLQLDQLLSTEVKSQLHCEVIFLTHDEKLSNWNKENFPTDSESLLWSPANQENKTNGRGSLVKRYKWQLKSGYVNIFKSLLTKHMPYCKIRYIF